MIRKGRRGGKYTGSGVQVTGLIQTRHFTPAAAATYMHDHRSEVAEEGQNVCSGFVCNPFSSVTTMMSRCSSRTGTASFV